jgi:nicotinate phosphoribosyltransferase
MASKVQSVPDGIFSLLDTDLYKLTMQCVVLKYFPRAGEFLGGKDLTAISLTPCGYSEVEYTFTNRTPEMHLNRTAFTWLQEQVSSEHSWTP